MKVHLNIVLVHCVYTVDLVLDVTLTYALDHLYLVHVPTMSLQVQHQPFCLPMSVCSTPSFIQVVRWRKLRWKSRKLQTILTIEKRSEFTASLYNLTYTVSTSSLLPLRRRDPLLPSLLLPHPHHHPSLPLYRSGGIYMYIVL